MTALSCSLAEPVGCDEGVSVFVALAALSEGGVLFKRRDASSKVIVRPNCDASAVCSGCEGAELPLLLLGLSEETIAVATPRRRGAILSACDLMFGGKSWVDCDDETILTRYCPTRGDERSSDWSCCLEMVCEMASRSQINSADQR